MRVVYYYAIAYRKARSPCESWVGDLLDTFASRFLSVLQLCGSFPQDVVQLAGSGKLFILSLSLYQ